MTKEGKRAWTRNSCLAGRLDRRVGVADQRLVAGARPRVELGQQDIIEWTSLSLRDDAVQIIAVAENDCLGRAALLAGGDDLAILDRPVLAIGRDLGLAD